MRYSIPRLKATYFLSAAECEGLMSNICNGKVFTLWREGGGRGRAFTPWSKKKEDHTLFYVVVISFTPSPLRQPVLSLLIFLSSMCGR